MIPLGASELGAPASFIPHLYSWYSYRYEFSVYPVTCLPVDVVPLISARGIGTYALYCAAAALVSVVRFVACTTRSPVLSGANPTAPASPAGLYVDGSYVAPPGTRPEVIDTPCACWMLRE